MLRRRSAMSVRKIMPLPDARDPFVDVDMRTDVRAMLLALSPRQRAALLLVDLLGYPSDEAARVMRVTPSTVRALATKGRQALRAREGAGRA